MQRGAAVGRLAVVSAWRRRALDLFPRHARSIEDSATTVYQLFFDLLPDVRDALARQDAAEVDRIFEFAAWCFDQKELSNAAAVAFYEHVFDGSWSDRHEIARRIPARIAADLMVLWEERLSEARMTGVRELFGLPADASPKRERRSRREP
jgi:hypothetical protein